MDNGKKKLHILITGEDEHVRSFVVSRKSIKIAFSILFFLVLVTGWFSVQNVDLRLKLHTIAEDLSDSNAKNILLQQRVAELKQTEEPLKNAVSELNQRSKIIESILSMVGIDIRPEEGTENTGGPFTSIDDNMVLYEELIDRVDYYLETIQPVPLGVPVAGGVITSKFGRRRDPFNGRLAFHSGIDIKNRSGSKVRATADGKVAKAEYDGKYGRYVLIDHENGFKTLYGHHKRLLAKRGQRVKRGQIIGVLGSSGRSTGPHLHYEIHYHNKIVSPMKFIHIADKVALTQG